MTTSPSWFAGPSVGLEEIRLSARRSAQVTDKAQAVHHHVDGRGCSDACELIGPDGTTVPLPLIAAPGSTVLGPDLTRALQANRAQRINGHG